MFTSYGWPSRIIQNWDLERFQVILFLTFVSENLNSLKNLAYLGVFAVFLVIWMMHTILSRVQFLSVELVEYRNCVHPHVDWVI